MKKKIEQLHVFVEHIMAERFEVVHGQKKSSKTVRRLLYSVIE